MKKLFNYALLAAALLVGVNVNAQTKVIEVSDPANLQAAFDDDANDITVKITSMGVQFNQAATIFLNADKKWTLDLNGHDLVYNNPNAKNATAATAFILAKGILHVKNGNVINATPVQAGTFKATGGGDLRCFYVMGTDLANAKSFKNEENPLSVYGTQLWIEEGVFVDCTYGKNGIEVYDFVVADGNIPAIGYDMEKKAATNISAAFGAYINVAGKVHGEKYGIQMSGRISKTPADIKAQFSASDEDARKYNFPRYDIEKTAEVYANPTLTGDGGAGVYLGGFCFANIHGYVHGSSGVYVKNGIVNITDAVIASDYTGTYVPGGHSGSSTAGAGSAIVIESNNNSYGDAVVTVGGDTKVTSEVGFAVEQKVNGDNAEKIEGIHITGGTFEGGTEGGVIFDNNTVIAGGVHIQDGNFTNGDVAGYLPAGATTTTVDDGQGNKTIVVSTSTSTPDPTTQPNDNIDNQTVLVWNNAEKKQTIGTNDEPKALKVGFFNMEKGAITIKKGSSLEITEKLIMGGEARIVVEPGATLISSGEKGIVAPSVDNIVIQTNELAEEGAGQFLFNPVVNSNKNTNATLQIIANSFTRKDAGETTYLKQRFGIPTHVAVKKITAVKSAEDNTPIQVGFSKWDIKKNAFVALGYINVPGASLNMSEMQEPFQYYQLQCNNVDKGTVVSMSGEMVSNSNNTLKVVNGWNTFANSYSGKMDILPMINYLLNNTQMNATVYKAAVADEAWINFAAVNLTSIAMEGTAKLNPMEAFLIQNSTQEVAQFVLNYQNMVWSPAMTTPATAPRHNSYEAMAKINVMQNDQNIDAIYMLQDASFTADIENGYDAEKYMNEKVNFYVNGADMKQQTLATNVLEGTYLGFAAKEAGVYTLSFDKMAGNNLVLVDLVNGQEIDMVNGAQYNFVVEANYSNDYRFMVKNAAQAPTAMDKVDAKANAVKVISGGEFRIVKDGRAYNAMGAEL